jgi:hypothetical protein
MKYQLLICSLLTGFSCTTPAASIYKCTKTTGAVIFTDTPCLGMRMEVVHQETEAEAKNREFKTKLDRISYLIQNNQILAAQAYAAEQNLSVYYEKALAAYKVDLEFKQRQETLAAQQQQNELQQQQFKLQQQTLQIQAQQLEQQKQQAAITQALQQQNYATPFLIQPCLSPRQCGDYFSPHHHLQQPTLLTPAPPPVVPRTPVARRYR